MAQYLFSYGHAAFNYFMRGGLLEKDGTCVLGIDDKEHTYEVHQAVLRKIRQLTENVDMMHQRRLEGIKND